MELRFPNRPALPLHPEHCPRLMGVLNVTPDSFSDGGRHVTIDSALAHARQMARQGADLIDIGGESTRPGARRVGTGEQKRRVLGVIEAIAAELPELPISIDTTRAEVAAAALDAGAAMVNDISAGREDAAMFDLAAERRAPIVLMHMQGEPATMQQEPTYDDVVADVERFLLDRAAQAQAAGIDRSAIVLDPGIGFGKTVEHNLALLAALPRFVASGFPVLLGASRKRFLSMVSPDADDPTDRIAGTCAATALASSAAVHLVRIHDVCANRQTLDVLAAVRAAGKKMKN